MLCASAKNAVTACTFFIIYQQLNDVYTCFSKLHLLRSGNTFYFNFGLISLVNRTLDFQSRLRLQLIRIEVLRYIINLIHCG